MDKLDRSGALSHCRCDALDGAAARVADSEHSRHARLQEKRLGPPPAPPCQRAWPKAIPPGIVVSKKKGARPSLHPLAGWPERSKSRPVRMYPLASISMA